MEKSLQEFVTEQTKKVLAAGSCCQELKDVAQAWLDAAGTPGEAEATKKYIQELEEDVTTIDGLIAFAQTDLGKKYLGEDGADTARAAKAAGAVWCTCDACQAGGAILEKKAELLK